MTILLKLENLAQFFLALWLFVNLEIAWWWYLLLFLAPDLSMLAYLHSPKLGSWFYNLFHHKAIAIGLFFLGLLLDSSWLAFAGTVLFGHAALDRVLGYGLKHPDSFNRTHLGRIGKIG